MFFDERLKQSMVSTRLRYEVVRPRRTLEEPLKIHDQLDTSISKDSSIRIASKQSKSVL